MSVQFTSFVYEVLDCLITNIIEEDISKTAMIWQIFEEKGTLSVNNFWT